MSTDREREAEMKRAGERYDIERELTAAGEALAQARGAEIAAMTKIAELARRGLDAGLPKVTMAAAARISRPHLDRLLDEGA